MRDSRLSTAWPRALDRAFVGDGGLWDPVKLFEGERKSVFEGKTKIERVRNVRGGATQQPYSSGPSAEDSNSFGRSSRRKKRTKEEAASPATSSTQRQRVWPPAAASATEASSLTQQPPKSEKENRKEPPHREEVARGFGQPRLGSAGGGFGRRTDRPAAAGPGVFGSGRGGPAVSGRWERSQGLRDQQGGRGFPAPRHRAADEEELPAWFDEAPLDKMEKLELTGLPEDMEAAEGDGGSKQAAAAPGTQEPQQPPQPFDGLLLGGGGSDVGSASSRFAKWLSMDEPPQPPTDEVGQRGGAQQQLERLFQDMRGRSGPETKQPQEAAAPTVGPSLMHLLRPPQKSEPPRPLHAQEVEASLKSMLFGPETAAPPPAVASAASSCGSAMPVLPPNGQARTLEEIESSLGAASGGSDRGSRGSRDSRAIYKLIGDLQVQMHDSAAGPVGSRQASVPPLLPASRQAQQQPPPQQQQQQQPQKQPQSKPLQPTAAPFIAQHALPPRSQPPPQQQPPTAPPMFSSGAGSQAAATAAHRRLPMPLQAQQLQQLQAMLLSNLQMQAQMMHGGQLSGGSANKSHPLNKLLPQTFRWYRAMNNALQGTRLLNQQFTGQSGAADFAGFEAAAGADAASFRRPNASAAAAAPLSTSSACHQPVAQPAMPIVPPMLLPPKTSSASSAAAAAGLQGWGGAHNQQLSAMLWNATRLAASVKSANPSVGWGLHRSPPVDSGVGQSHRAPPTKPVDEMPSA